MDVYAVLKIADYEYGCRKVEKLFSTPEKAEEYVENSKDNYDYTFWDGSIEPNLIIRTYQLDERY